MFQVVSARLTNFKRLYLSLDVQRKYSEWIKLATTNLRDPCDVAPLRFC